jgi:PII-like signaling protein
VELTGQAVLMRIFVGESDKVAHAPLYERIVQAARTSGLAGATAWKGVTGFGANSIIRTARVLDLSADLPVVIELADEEKKIQAFQNVLDDLFEQADCGGLVTIERVNVHRYLPGNSRESGAGQS